MRIRARKALISAAMIAASLLPGCSSQPLEPWHTARLAEEFDAGMRDEVDTLADYLELEDRLFDEVRRDVVSEVGTGPEFALVRYSAGSAADPETRKPNYNRTFELPAEDARGGALLLHGMSDSPYSLLRIGQTLNANGYWVVGLRLPGHGTVPAGLKSVRWEDMAAAARLGMEHIVDRIGDKPIHVVGYSTGAGLALDAALAALDDNSRRMPTSLVLISPAIGISRAAALAGTQATIGRVPGFSGAAYTQVVPEFDPYKYNSFTANAGSQVHRLTRSVAGRVARIAGGQDAYRLPPMLVFKSAVDATVSTEAVVDNLLGRLPNNGHKLVLFDINRSAFKSTLLVVDPGPLTDRLMRDGSLPFSIWLIGNDSAESRSIVASYKPPMAVEIATRVDLDLDWPRGVISLSHVALPFAPDDELYGTVPPEDPDTLFLGPSQIRGERGLLRIPSDWLMRIRYNPFYEVLESQLLEWLDTTEPAR